MDNNSLRISPQLVVGFLVILIGIFFTLDNLEVIDSGDYIRYWPVLIVIYGITRMLQPAGSTGRVLGGFLAILGTLMLLHRFDVISFPFRNWWPLLLIGLGATLLFRSTKRRTVLPAAGDANSTVNLFAIFGGFERTCNSQDFRGGELTAIMGGCELDLRRASISANEAVIDVFAFWGGVNIRIPEDWGISVQGFPFMGAIEDKTHPPQGGSKKLLIIRGYAIMGGAEICN